MKKFLFAVVTAFLIAAINFSSALAANQNVAENNNSERLEEYMDTPKRVKIPQQMNTPQQLDTRNFPYEVLRLVNIERAKVGLSPLTFANDLASSAYTRARELPQKFSHTRPNGTKCFTAMPKYGHVLGENLAGGHTSPQQVVQAWMDSPSHRANILGKNFTELGVVYYYEPNSKYKHYWVQHFRG